MADSVKIWVLGALAATFNIASLVLNVVFASSIRQTSLLSALRALLFVAFAFSLIATAGLTFFSTLYVRNLYSHSLGLTRPTWQLFSSGIFIAAASLIVSGITLVWLVVEQKSIPEKVMNQSSITLLGVWFALWAVSMVLQITLYTMLARWTKQELRTQSFRRSDLDFGIRMPQMDEIRPTTQDTRTSFNSQDITLNSPPRTPTSRRGSSARRSSSTRVGPGSSRTKLVRSSARSSLDLQPCPANEAMSIDSAFDAWDTSSVHREMRMTIHSSPPVTRSGLETIPGSRPDSPANTLEGPFLPSSPIHAASSDTPTPLGWNPDSSSPTNKLSTPKSSPPSSPPNFSRPTSSHHNKAPPPKFGKNLQDWIHPLFRPNSPHPPPIAAAGTTVTASPMAEQLITPRTLEKLRSKSRSQNFQYQKQNQDEAQTIPAEAQPPVEASTVQELPDSPTLHPQDRQNRFQHQPGTPTSPTLTVPDSPRSPGPGSPGPSIVEEDNSEDRGLPPILPTFVLSAGSRSSLIGYGKRKSVKEKRASQLSIGSRLSGLWS